MSVTHLILPGSSWERDGDARRVRVERVIRREGKVEFRATFGCLESEVLSFSAFRDLYTPAPGVRAVRGPTGSHRLSPGGPCRLDPRTAVIPSDDVA